MNIEKIYNALMSDEKNSALQIICAELFLQGYQVLIDGAQMNSQDFDENVYKDFERSSDHFEITLLKNNKHVQRFNIRFIDFHRFEIYFRDNQDS